MGKTFIHREFEYAEGFLLALNAFSVLLVKLCCLTDIKDLCKQTSVILCKKENKTSGIEKQNETTLKFWLGQGLLFANLIKVFYRHQLDIKFKCSLK